MQLGRDVQRAVRILQAGGLVAFPTETVYGLGADAENPAAVARLFAAKGRPTHHPLIVHFGQAGDLAAWAAEVPASAWRLAERFWPGPLTLILRRHVRVPDAVTGGLETVGLRVPRHPMAQALLSVFGGGVAAPSANRFGRVSPTTAEHVQAELGKAVDYIVDGGPCEVGLESTIVDLSAGVPAILRPGGVTQEELEATLGHPVPMRSGGVVRSPGQLASHYAPRARVVLAPPGELLQHARLLHAQGIRVALLVPPDHGLQSSPAPVFLLPETAAAVAHSLYAMLRHIDRLGFAVILVSLPPEKGLGTAIADRLRRAAGPRQGEIPPPP
jgi:L-threonylcarbamoyladenylate synthase